MTRGKEKWNISQKVSQMEANEDSSLRPGEDGDSRGNGFCSRTSWCWFNGQTQTLSDAPGRHKHFTSPINHDVSCLGRILDCYGHLNPREGAMLVGAQRSDKQLPSSDERMLGDLAIACGSTKISMDGCQCALDEGRCPTSDERNPTCEV